MLERPEDLVTKHQYEEWIGNISTHDEREIVLATDLPARGSLRKKPVASLHGHSDRQSARAPHTLGPNAHRYHGAKDPVGPEKWWLSKLRGQHGVKFYVNPATMYFQHHGFAVFQNAVMTSLEVVEVSDVNIAGASYTAQLRLIVYWYDKNYVTAELAAKRKHVIHDETKKADTLSVTSYCAPDNVSAVGTVENTVGLLAQMMTDPATSIKLVTDQAFGKCRSMTGVCCAFCRSVPARRCRHPACEHHGAPRRPSGCQQVALWLLQGPRAPAAPAGSTQRRVPRMTHEPCRATLLGVGGLVPCGGVATRRPRAPAAVHPAR